MLQLSKLQVLSQRKVQMKWEEYQNTRAPPSLPKPMERKTSQKQDHLCRGFSNCRRPTAAREGWLSGAHCQKAVIDCQPQLKMISESGVRSSALCFSPSLSGGWKGKPCHQHWPSSDLFISTHTPQDHHITVWSLGFLQATTDNPVSVLSAVLNT